jgi:hypothetical protein
LFYRLAAIAFKAAFLFLAVADFTNFNAADLTRLVVADVPFLAGLRFGVALRFTAVRFFAVVLRLADCFAVDFLRVKSPILFYFNMMILHLPDPKKSRISCPMLPRLEGISTAPFFAGLRFPAFCFFAVPADFFFELVVFPAERLPVVRFFVFSIV